MNIRKRILILAAVLLFFNSPVKAADAEPQRYYIIEGAVFFDGSAIIDRLETSYSPESIENVYGTEYSLVAYTNAMVTVSATPIAVNFSAVSDNNGVLSGRSPFMIVMPYDEDIIGFYVYRESDAAELCYAVPTDAIQFQISFFDVEERDDGFYLSWEVELCDESNYSSLNYEWAFEYLTLDYNITAVSAGSGVKNVLYYRGAENSLFVPYDWLEEDEAVYFILESNDGRSTLVCESGEYEVLNGVSFDMTINDEWYSPEEDGDSEDGDLLFYIIVGAGALALVAATAAVTLAIAKKKK